MAPTLSMASLRSRALLVILALALREETLAVGETSCGGLLATVLGGDVERHPFAGAIIAYGMQAKSTLLIHEGEPQPRSAVSPELARHLAKSARSILGTTWGLGETGIAGPQTGRRSKKPAGLAFIAVTGPVELVMELHTGRDNRTFNIYAFAAAALDVLEAALQKTRIALPANAPQL